MMLINQIRRRIYWKHQFLVMTSTKESIILLCCRHTLPLAFKLPILVWLSNKLSWWFVDSIVFENWLRFFIFYFFKLKARDEPFEPDSFEEDFFIQRRSGCTIFLGYTSNIISSGIRDTIRFLVQHKLVWIDYFLNR